LRKLVKDKNIRVIVPVEDLDRLCDRCHKPYSAHPVDKEGVVDVCGWLVTLRSMLPRMDTP
jgi:hypothetical protein